MPLTYDELLADEVLRREFLKTRTIGGSQIGAVLGVSPFADAARVYDDIYGIAAPIEDNQYLQRGRAMEHVVADEYARATGRLLTIAPPAQRDDRFPFLRFSPDRIIHYDEGDTGTLEIKVLGQASFRETQLHGVHPSYLAQLQHYLSAQHQQRGAFAILHPDSWTFHYVDVVLDPAVCEAMYAQLATFWFEAVVPMRRPAGGYPVTVRLLTEEHGIRRDDPEFLTLMTGLKAVQDELKQLETRKAYLVEGVKRLLGDAVTNVRFPGGSLSWTESVRESFDADAFFAAHPELAREREQYVRRTVSRPFRSFFR